MIAQHPQARQTKVLRITMGSTSCKGVEVTSLQSGTSVGSGQPKTIQSARGAPATTAMVHARCPTAVAICRPAGLVVGDMAFLYGPAKPRWGRAVAVPVMLRCPMPKVWRKDIGCWRVM